MSWEKDVGITWKRFDGYWGGKPYLDGIEMQASSNYAADLMSLKAGRRDMMVLDPKDAKDLEKESRDST